MQLMRMIYAHIRSSRLKNRFRSSIIWEQRLLSEVNGLGVVCGILVTYKGKLRLGKERSTILSLLFSQFFLLFPNEVSFGFRLGCCHICINFWIYFDNFSNFSIWRCLQNNYTDSTIRTTVTSFIKSNISLFLLHHLSRCCFESLKSSLWSKVNVKRDHFPFKRLNLLKKKETVAIYFPIKKY